MLCSACVFVCDCFSMARVTRSLGKYESLTRFGFHFSSSVDRRCACACMFTCVWDYWKRKQCVDVNVQFGQRKSTNPTTLEHICTIVQTIDVYGEHNKHPISFNRSRSVWMDDIIQCTSTERPPASLWFLSLSFSFALPALDANSIEWMCAADFDQYNNNKCLMFHIVRGSVRRPSELHAD